MHDQDQNRFEPYVRQWALDACRDWEFPHPTDETFEKLRARLLAGLLTTIALGVEAGIVIPKGRTFTLMGLDPKKGPYNWFSPVRLAKRLNPNWEYYVQVAEFVRLSHLFGSNGYTLTFEDDFMDIGVYKDRTLVVCCEIKEKSNQAKRLISGIKSFETSIAGEPANANKDPHRKANYLVKHKPLFFYLVAIGVRYEFSVSYPPDKAFELKEDIIPFI